MCEKPVPTLESTPKSEEEIAVPAQEFIVPDTSDCTNVPIYFNANDVKHEVELKKLESYKFPDNHTVDGIGLFIDTHGRLGVAYWYRVPTVKNPSNGVWLRQGYLRPEETLEFQKCYELVGRRLSVYKQLNKTQMILERKGMHGPALMIDDKYRGQFSQVAHLTMKINQTFRKIWFKKDVRKIFKNLF